MSDEQPDAQDKARRGRGLQLDLSDLDPEVALRGFMQVDPQKVKKRIEEEEPDEDDHH